MIPRIGASITRYGSAVLRQFELMGCYTPNPSDAILKARDKLRTHQLLAAQAIGLPSTVFGDNPDDTDDLLSMLGAPPHVIKLSEGTQGAGVMLAEKLSAARGMVEALRGLRADFLVQEFIEEAKGADLRCFVVGGKVVGAMRRQAAHGDFRSNLHRGGSAKAIMPTRDEIEVAVRAAQVLGLNVAGVDLIRAKRGPLVLEVNSSPGLEGIEFATGMDIAGIIIDHVCASDIVSNAALRRRRRVGSSKVPTKTLKVGKPKKGTKTLKAKASANSSLASSTKKKVVREALPASPVKALKKQKR